MRLRLLIVSAAVLIVACNNVSRGGSSSGPPPGWVEADQQTSFMYAQGKPADVIKTCEPFVRDYPDFADAHFCLAVALRSMADDMSRDPSLGPLRKQNLEQAVVHYERYHELATPENRAGASLSAHAESTFVGSR